MIQFFAPDILTNPILPESDSQHCIRVLRMREGDDITVVDGRGHRLTCRIAAAHPKHTLVEVTTCTDVPKPWHGNITVAVAPTKHLDRMEWLVEKLVEVGVDRFVPLLCNHSERREIKVERLEKIAVSAMKQSLKTTLPAIDEMMPLGRFIESVDKDSQRFVGYCDDAVERRLLAKELRHGVDTVLMIGPEGDFSPAEIEAVIASGFTPVTLGDCRLRTETAALTACETFHIINQLHS